MDEQMRRLDACIDACAGISTEALEAGVITELVNVAKWVVRDRYVDREIITETMSAASSLRSLKETLAKLETPDA